MIIHERLLRAVAAVDDELLVLVSWTTLFRNRSARRGICLMRGHGLGSHNKKIVWQ